VASFSEIARKKVAGIPVIYLAGAVAVVLAIVAYRTSNKTPTTDGAGTADAAGTGVDGNGNAVDEGAAYAGLATNGTVTVAPQAPAQETAVQQTNDQWLRSASSDVAAAKIATIGDAQAALAKYLAGDNLSFDEGKIRDYALQKDGLPPEPLVQVGTVSEAPAQKQFSLFPGKHTVKGTNDNTPAKLAQLYYGNADALHVNSIVSQNFNLGPSTTTYSVGTVVSIPESTTPRYFTVVKGYQYPTQIAAKNGISYAQLIGLNPGVVFPVAIGTKVRVL
jgi:hypothetical protein